MREKGCVGNIQKVGACAESDRTEALGCQRTLWAVHTEPANSTEIGPVQGGIGQGNRSRGMRDGRSLITSRQRQPGNLAVSYDLVSSRRDPKCKHFPSFRRNANIAQGNSAANLF
jgi:hypothetical protein